MSRTSATRLLEGPVFFKLIWLKIIAPDPKH